MFYLPLGLLAKHNPQFVELAMRNYHLTTAQISHLTWGSIFAENLIPVIIGNFIGGAFVVAGTFYTALKKV